MSEVQPAPKRNFITRIFISSDEPRLRGGWRLSLQTIIMVILSSCLSIPIMFYFIMSGVLTSDFNFDHIPKEILLPSQFVELVTITGSIYIARRFLDKRSFVSLGLQVNKQAFADILIGIAITFVMMGLIYLAEIAAGWLTFESFAWQIDSIPTVMTGVLTFLAVFIFVGWNEELLSRGYHLQTLASGLNVFWGVVISSSLFGLAHLGNPNATWVSAAGIFFAGLFLAYGLSPHGSTLALDWIAHRLEFL